MCTYEETLKNWWMISFIAVNINNNHTYSFSTHSLNVTTSQKLNKNCQQSTWKRTQKYPSKGYLASRCYWNQRIFIPCHYKYFSFPWIKLDGVRKERVMGVGICSWETVWHWLKAFNSLYSLFLMCFLKLTALATV